MFQSSVGCCYFILYQKVNIENQELWKKPRQKVLDIDKLKKKKGTARNHKKKLHVDCVKQILLAPPLIHNNKNKI